MSTHLEEMKHLVNTANANGGQAELLYDDDGRVDEISVKDLEGMRDMQSTPLAVVEIMRRAIGQKAKKIAVSLDSDRNPLYSVSLGQAKAYGGGESMIKGLIYGNKIPLNSKFMAQYPTDFEGENVVTEYLANIEGQLFKFDSKEDYKKHDASKIKTNVTSFSFDMSDPEQVKAYEKETRELGYQNIVPFKSSHDPEDAIDSGYLMMLNSLSEVVLDKKGYKGDQWSAQINGKEGSDVKLFDWHELSSTDSTIKQGYYLDQTDSMKQARRENDNNMSFR